MNIEERTNDLIERFWEWRLIDIPEFATSLGKHEYDDRLMDMSLNAYLRRRDDAKQFLKQTRVLQEVAKTDNASYDTMFHLDYLEDDLDCFIKGLTYQTYLCPLNPIEGPHVRFPGLLSWMKRDSVADVEKILTRLRLFPHQIDQIIQLLTEGIRIGLTMYIKSIQPFPEALLAVSKVAVEDSKLFEPFKEKPGTIPKEIWNKLVDTAKDIIAKECLPSFERLGTFISETYIPKCRSAEGLGVLPNGKNIYEACVRFHTEQTVTAKQLHELGHEQLKKALVRFDEIQKKIGFEGSRADFLKHLRSEPFGYKSEQEMLETYRKVSDKVMAQLPKFFVKMPSIDLEIVPAPSEVAREYVNAAYCAGAPDNSRPGYFVVNTYRPEIRKRFEAVVLTVHEALPGHHIQIATTMESPLKEFRRFPDELRYWDPPAHLGMKSGYHEGWASYAEYLGIEMGLYDEDPYDMVGKISREMVLATRLIVDTGIHMYGWGRQESIDYLMENTACDEYDIITEVDRYISLPGQSLSYGYGEIKMLEFRARTEKALGDAFNLPEFHQMIASLGDVPLFLLDRHVNKFISDKNVKAA